MEPTEATIEDFDGILEKELSLSQDEYLTKWVDYLKTFKFRGKSIDTTTLQEGIQGEIGNKYKLMPLYGKTFPDQFITRAHLVRQLVNMVNDKSLYVYIPLRRVGSYGIPNIYYDWLHKAKNPEELNKPILAVKRIVENDDRYRAEKDHLSGVFSEDVGTYPNNSMSLKSKIDFLESAFEKYEEQARQYSLANDEQPGPENTEEKQPVKQNDVTEKKSTETTKPTTTTTTKTEKTRADYEKEIDELKKKLHLAEITANELQDAVNSGSNSYAQNAEELKQTQRELRKANADLKNKDDLIQQWRTENTKLKTELDAVKKKVSDKEAEIQRIKTQGSNMASSEKKQLEDKVRTLEEINKNLTTGNTNDIIIGLKKEIKRLTEQYEESEYSRIDETNSHQKEKDVFEVKIQKLEDELETYAKMKRYQLHDNVSSVNGLASDYVGPTNELSLIESKSIATLGKRLSLFNDMTYIASNMKQYQMAAFKTGDLNLDNFYQVDDPGIQGRLKEMLQKELDSGTKASFVNLQSEILLDALADNFQNAYRGSETLTISFLVDGDVKTSLKISNLAFQVIGEAGDGGLCTIPMHDTESHNKVYSAFSPLGKNVIASKGEFIVERDGFEPLKLNYKMDRGELEGELFHGRGLLISKDGIGLFTKFLSQAHLEIDKIVIIESKFKEKKANILNYSSLNPAPITETNELEGEAEVFEVPIYPVEKSIISENLSISSTQGEEGDWPSGF